MARSSSGKKPLAAADVPALIAALADKNAATRRRAREGLVVVGRPAVEAVVGLFDDRRAHVRWEAAKALGGIADPRAASILVEVLEEDEDCDVRWLAAAALIAIGRDGLRLLLAALADRPDSITLQDGAYHVCRSLGRKRAFQLVRPVLAAIKAAEPELAIPAAIRDALEELKA